jgi:hypothetical protein
VRRTVLAALAALALPLAATGAAASGCPLVPDEAGDGHLTVAATGAWLLPQAFESDDLDLLSVDLASGPTTVVAVVRVASLAPDAWTAAGVDWDARWHLGDTYYLLSAHRDHAGAYRATLFVTEPGTNPAALPAPALTVDATAATLTFVLPRSSVAALATDDTFAGLSAASWFAPDGRAFTNADVATTRDTYVDRTPGCVPAA